MIAKAFNNKKVLGAFVKPWSEPGSDRSNARSECCRNSSASALGFNSSPPHEAACGSWAGLGIPRHPAALTPILRGSPTYTSRTAALIASAADDGEEPRVPPVGYVLHHPAHGIFSRHRRWLHRRRLRKVPISGTVISTTSPCEGVKSSRRNDPRSRKDGSCHRGSPARDRDRK